MFKKINKTERRKIRQRHRSISLFALIQCWLRDIDGLVFTHYHLERLLHIKTIRRSRISWLIEDMQEFFPSSVDLWSEYPKSLTALFVSRKSINHILQKEQNDIPKQIEIMKQNGMHLELCSLWSFKESKELNYDERVLLRYLSLLAQGKIPAGRIPHMKKNKGS